MSIQLPIDGIDKHTKIILSKSQKYTIFIHTREIIIKENKFKTICFYRLFDYNVDLMFFRFLQHNDKELFYCNILPNYLIELDCVCKLHKFSAEFTGIFKCSENNVKDIRLFNNILFVYSLYHHYEKWYRIYFFNCKDLENIYELSKNIQNKNKADIIYFENDSFILERNIEKHFSLKHKKYYYQLTSKEIYEINKEQDIYELDTKTVFSYTVKNNKIDCDVKEFDLVKYPLEMYDNKISGYPRELKLLCVKQTLYNLCFIYLN